jgi:hypothetical protein
MKQIIRTLFAPLLKVFESGAGEFSYKQSHRIILLVMGGLFSALAVFVFFAAQGQDLGYFLPVLIFGGVGIVSLVIGFVGTDRAVAKIWGSR